MSTITSDQIKQAFLDNVLTYEENAANLLEQYYARNGQPFASGTDKDLLFRSIAGYVTFVGAAVAKLNIKGHPLTASGVDLDIIGAKTQTMRKVQVPSKVIVELEVQPGPAFKIDAGFIVETKNGFQFELSADQNVLDNTTLLAVKYSAVFTAVVSGGSKYESFNGVVSANDDLIMPQSNARISKATAINSSYGGIDYESDNDYRLRIQDIYNMYWSIVTTLSRLKSYFYYQVPDLLPVYIPDTPVDPGYIDVYAIDMSRSPIDSTRKNQILNGMPQDLIPIGDTIRFKDPTRVTIPSLTITIRANNLTNETKASILTKIYSYFKNLAVGKNFYTSDLIETFKHTENVIDGVSGVANMIINKTSYIYIEESNITVNYVNVTD